jgi:hypothetical protein
MKINCRGQASALQFLISNMSEKCSAGVYPQQSIWYLSAIIRFLHLCPSVKN